VGIRIAILTDTHLDDAPTPTGRRGDVADVLLRRAVFRLNRLTHPDVALLLGDVVEDGEGPRAADGLLRIRRVLDETRAPAIAIPGNHDGGEEAFYRAFDRPPEFLDVAGVRFVPFIDPTDGNHNATRTEPNMRRMDAVRADGFTGPVVAVQHVPVFPPGACDCPFNYTNAGEILESMRRNGIVLALAGHIHGGLGPVRWDGAACVAGPCISEPPFVFFEVRLDGTDISLVRHQMRMRPELALVDTHVHTQFAYCSRNMNIERALDLADAFGLAGLGFSEHSDQLYFERQFSFSTECYNGGIDVARDEDRRVDDYLAAAQAAGVPPAHTGLEAECDARGRPMVRAEDRERVGYLIGGLHNLPALLRKPYDYARACEEFPALLERFLSSGIAVLAHPFRLFARRGLPVPEHLFPDVVRLLRAAGVAAEINCRANAPPPEFVRMCIEAGVKLSLGSDAHNLCEIGEFAPHLALLEQIGYDGDLWDILVDPRG